MQRIKSLSEYFNQYEKSQKDPEGFWSEIADSFNWIKPWSKVLESDFEKVNVKWFIDAKLNITENIFENLVKNKDKTVCRSLIIQMKKQKNFLSRTRRNL